MVSDRSYSPSSSQDIPLDAVAEDHRKRRRNRTRVSCLNCYASKRKCDRKRPCTRCVKHGLTGLCVYELDDPTARDRSHLDEKTRLKYRIAELESTIREMNNRPHPRWTAPGGVTHDPGLLRRGPTRRVKEKPARSSSVDAFFAAIADVEDEGSRIKVEQDNFIPEFTPSDLGSPLTPLSSLSPVSSTSPAPTPLRASPSSAPFTFNEETYSDTRPLLSSYVQGAEGETNGHSCRSLGLSVTEEAHSPAASDSSEDGPPLASLVSGGRPGPSTPAFSLNFPPPNWPPSFLPELPEHAELGTQTTPVPSRSATPPPLMGAQTDEPNCRCLIDPTVYNPLVFFASSLRTSREALEALHPPSSNCVLFRRIMELDDHIFSASPPTPPTSPKVWPVHELDATSLYSTSDLVMPSAAPNSIYSSVRHPHAHALPFYSHPSLPSDYHQYTEPASQRVHACELDSYAYFADASSVYRDWM